MRYFKKLIAILIIIFISLLLTEGALRVISPLDAAGLKLNKHIESERGKFTRYDSTLGWTGKENAQGDFSWADTSHYVRQNSFGFRDNEYDLSEKKARRTVVLGDSFVWGFGVKNDEIFTSLLEKDDDGSHEFINLGVSGYGTDQEYLLWRQMGPRLSPDEVLLFITPYTDLADVIFSEAYEYPKPQFVIDASGRLTLTNVPVPAIKEWAKRTILEAPVEQRAFASWLLTHSTLANRLLMASLRNNAVRQYLEKERIALPRTMGNAWDYLIYAERPSAQVQMAWRTLFAIVGELEKDVTARGAKFKVVIVPSMLRVYPELWTKFTRQPNIPRAARLDPSIPARLITNWCKERNIDYIDLFEDLKEAGKKDPYLYFPINRHWTKQGHKVVAKRLKRELMTAK